MTKSAGRSSQSTGQWTVPEVLSSFISANRLKKVVIACSGGPDSVALVLAASEIGHQFVSLPVVAHVNHVLRGRESAADQAFVERLAAGLGLPVRVFRRPVRQKSGNLEENARDARYGTLASLARRHRADAVLTAHTADDQAETVLMNLFRGCGADGLGGMSPFRRDDALGFQIGRPFLGVSREDLRAYLREKGQTFRKDSSNDNPSFFRNYLRIKAFKEIERRSPGFAGRVARLATLLRDEQAQWDEWVEMALSKVAKSHRGGWLLDRSAFDHLSLGLQRRVLRRVAGNDLLTFDGVERLRVWMESPPSDGRFWQLRKNWVVERLSKMSGSPSSSLFWFHRPKDR